MQDNLEKIKSKLLELAALIKEQTSEETKELKEEILHNLNDMKTEFEERLQEVQGKYGDSIQEIWNDLERKADEVQGKIREKLSYGLPHRDEIIDKTAESLIEAINRAKDILQNRQR